MKTILVDPIDVWLFRDGRPFAAGEDHRARSIFPPYPATLYGALRTAGMAREGVDFDRGFRSDRFGDARGPGSFRLRGPLLRRGQELLFPLPSDIARAKKDKEPEKEPLLRLRPTRGLGFSAGDGLEGPALAPLTAHATTDEIESPGGYLDSDGLRAWMEGEAPPPDSWIPSRVLFSVEERIGLALDDVAGRRPRPGLLYSAQFVRPRTNVGLAAWADDPGEGLEAGGLLRLGGDGHAASFRTADGPHLPPPPRGPRTDLAVLLLTPALSGSPECSGWKPRKLLEKIPGSLESAALGRPVPVGGWDLAANVPKPILRAVPAGSVYFFRLRQAEDFDKTASSIHGMCVSDLMEEAGFGLAIVGGWNHV
jgi:CRISPR-associated protein Cmr3